MTKSYRKITQDLARKIRLVIADVDGLYSVTATPSVRKSRKQSVRWNHCGIMVGFDSGRPLTRLEPLATSLQTSGPVIAENGCVAKLTKKADCSI